MAAPTYNYEPRDLLAIADRMLAAQNYHLGADARETFADHNREFTPEDLTTLAESDIRASRVFELATHAPGQPGGKE